MESIWSETAKRNYKQNLNYLLEEWGYSVMKNFILKLEDTVEKLKMFPEIGAFYKQIGCQKILVVKQIYLFYEVKDECLHILDVWNNHTRPYWD